MTAVRGWVYVITNKAMPGLVKVGYTLKDPNLRAKELDSTGMPHPYVVEYEALVEDPYETEQLVHSRLSHALEAKEWFRCAVSVAVAELQAVVGSAVFFERVHAARGSALAAEDPRSPPSITAEVDSSAESARAERTPPRPTGTYAGECWYCGDHFSATLTPQDNWVRCPECFRLNDAKKFQRQELYV